MLKQTHLSYVERRQPETNDLVRGWHAAEFDVPYTEHESDDWKMGWRLWHHEHGAKRLEQRRGIRH